MTAAVEVALDQLILMGLVEAAVNDEGLEVYRLTQAGKDRVERRRAGR